VGGQLPPIIPLDGQLQSVFSVIPAKAGIQEKPRKELDSRFRGNDIFRWYQ
jgi:hypothetical protein